MHLTTLLTTLTTLVTFSSLATAAIVQGASYKVGHVDYIVCPPNAAPKDTVCDPTRRKIGVCPKAGAKAVGSPLKEGQKCGDPN